MPGCALYMCVVCVRVCLCVCVCFNYHINIDDHVSILRQNPCVKRWVFHTFNPKKEADEFLN